MVRPAIFAACPGFLSLAASAVGSPTTPQPNFGPDKAVARQNAFHIFNAVHSTMRQWGSSLNHNGMSLFLATVPTGNLFYHGTHSVEVPARPEWLAFEIEHAEGFARPRRRRPPPDGPGEPGRGPPPPTLDYQPGGQLALLDANSADEGIPNAWMGAQRSFSLEAGGFLHIYRTTAPLRLLYIDGMGAGKTEMGTLDTQDILLRNIRSTIPIDEGHRAAALCELVTSWGLDGVIRMEAGFEIIKCDFTKDLELVSARQRPGSDGERGPGAGDDSVYMLEYMRAVSQRYGGVGAQRVRVDWGSMVSALWYPVNLTNPDSTPAMAALPRLVNLSDDELEGIRSRLREVISARLGFDDSAPQAAPVDWQAVVDAIVARYADKLRYMAEKVASIGVMRGEVNTLVNLFLDYADDGPDFEDAMSNCVSHYLSSSTPVTQEDHLIFAAVDEVSRAICSTLFEVRRLVIDNTETEDEALEAAAKAVRQLMERLAWTKWKECPTCSPDEVCFVAMWPFGDTASHEQPSCRNSSNLRNDRADSYWHRFR